MNIGNDNSRILKICIVKLSAMGDIIHAMVALQFIKKHLPNVTIDWIVEESFQGVLENNPHINEILPVNLKSIKKNKLEFFKQIKLLNQYAKNNYDVVLDAQGLLKSAIVSKIVGGRIIGSIVSGFDKDSIREGIASWFYDRKISIPYSSNTIDRNVKVLCAPLDIKTTKEEILEKEPFLFCDDSYSNVLGKEYNLFVIGSTWESRNYPKEKFIEIANELKIQTYVVWGSSKEKDKALWMEKQSKYLTSLEKVSLDELKFIIKNANLVIGNDTGPTHMAWGLNIPSITIFGPTPTNRVYITPINKVVKSKSQINHYKLDKSDFSICEIKVEEIIHIAKELLNC